jgi:CRP-like cAMP-binding protein
MNRKELEQLSTSFKELTYRPGDTIAVEGERRDMRLFVISDGTASVTVGGIKRRTLGPGDAFGEVALIDGGERSATVVADTDLRCYGITPWVFRPLVEEQPEMAWKLLEGLATLVRSAEQRQRQGSGETTPSG